LYGNGGAMVDKDGKPAFNSPEGVAALTWMVQSVDDGISNPASISYVEEDVRNVFSQGKAVFALNWNYMFDMANNNPKESQITGKVKVAPIPVFKKTMDAGVTSSSINGSMGFSVAAKSPSQDAAWAYVVYLTSEDVQNRYSAHMLPIWQTSFAGESGAKLAAMSDATKVMVPAFNAQFPTAHVRPKVPYYQEGSKALQLAIQQALTKQKSPKDALDTAAAKWVELAAK
jgi:multiple sugar transport system substrate-binding protein